ncbi:MAG: hypothetical protein FWH10_05390 [Oscillospiraceae bacterium]|nr:hypothetical protein [Oscillospiraceae bacterium]
MADGGDNRTPEEILGAITALAAEKLNILREILDISLKIKDEAGKALETPDDDEADEAVENIGSLVNLREELTEETGNIELSLKHYGARLKDFGSDIFDISKSAELKKFADDTQTTLDAIKDAGEESSRRIAELMGVIKAKIKSVKNNKALMDRYVGGNETNPPGTLMSEKK